MNETLSQLVEIAPRFTRSVNVERDKEDDAIDGYILTSRAIDVLQRIQKGITNNKNGRSFSLTGPHGGGKSSLAVFIDALSENRKSTRFNKALEMLSSVDEDLGQNWLAAVSLIDPRGKGAYSAFVTAQRESVTASIVRAITVAVGKDKVPKEWLAHPGSPSSQQILSFLEEKLKDSWMVLVIDEFGKNLEHFSEDPQSSDLYLLQLLAEAAQGGENSLNLILVTLQHMSFDEYVQNLSANQRREWIKVQGRFQDIAYVESEIQTARLMSKAVKVTDEKLLSVLTDWTSLNKISINRLGYVDGTKIDNSIAYPLHPTAQAVLPSLCARYGQNERTLFSFIAGSEPNALPSLIEKITWSKSDDIHWVQIIDVYNYFLASSSTVAAGSQGSSRFLEIEARIRDASGMSEELVGTLKTIGILNLVSAGGSLRASRDTLEFALVGPNLLFDSEAALDNAISGLESSGLVTYREFADEYRIWQGSDFDLKKQVSTASERLATNQVSSLLNNLIELEPVVAARHSQETGIFRVFAQTFVESDVVLSENPIDLDDVDGYLFIGLGKTQELPKLEFSENRPVVYASISLTAKLRSEIKEAAALNESLKGALDKGADWVAVRELRERSAIATSTVRRNIERLIGQITELQSLQSGSSYSTRAGLSSGVSAACDDAYHNAPVMRNETISKRNLSTQGAKARRILLEKLIDSESLPLLGIQGYGPERAIYDAIFKSSGIHRLNRDYWEISEPTDERWREIWNAIIAEIKSLQKRSSVISIQSKFLKPPYGLREGIFSIVFVSILQSMQEEVALFEHGSLVLKIDDAVLERFLKNPNFFTVKYLSYSEGKRLELFEMLCDRFKLQKKDGSRPTFLAAMKSIYREIGNLPPTTIKTRNLDNQVLKVRDAFLRASELDELLYVELPTIVLGQRVDNDVDMSEKQLKSFIETIAKSLKTLKSDFPSLMERFQEALSKYFEIPGNLQELRRELSDQSERLFERIKDGELRALAPAFMRQQLDDQAWLENIGLIVTGGQPPKHWTDREREFAFEEVTRLGGVFNRLKSLYFEELESDETDNLFRRITLTSPDGSEISKVLSITPEELSVAESKVQTMRNSKGKLSEAEVREFSALLLAIMAKLER